MAKEKQAPPTPHEVSIQRHSKHSGQEIGSKEVWVIRKDLARVSRYRDTTTTVEAANAEQCDCCGMAVKKTATSIEVAANTVGSLNTLYVCQL